MRGKGSLPPVAGVAVVLALLALAGFLAVWAAGASWLGTVEGAADHRLLVVASTTILADLARQVGGDRVQVYSLLSPGQDPHSYEPVPRDGLALSRADLVLLNGYGLDLWAERLLGGIPRQPGADPPATPGAGSGLPVVDAGGDAGQQPVLPTAHRLSGVAAPRILKVAEAIAARPLPWPGAPGHHDPHLWMDPVLVMEQVGVIATALGQLDPAGQAQYAERARQLRTQLDQLDRWIREQVATIPPHRRLLVTTHDAYRYLGRRYGLRVLDTVWGISTEEEPSAAELARLLDRLKDYGVPAFVESTINPKLMEELAAQAGVPIGGRLYADSLGPPGSGADTYLGMMRHNVATLVEALTAQDTSLQRH